VLGMIHILLLVGFSLMFFVIFGCLALFSFCFYCLFLGKDFLDELAGSLDNKGSTPHKK